MAKLKIIIDLDFDSWFDEERKPKTNTEWEIFLINYLIPESSLLGIDDGEYQDMIALNNFSLNVIEFN